MASFLEKLQNNITAEAKTDVPLAQFTTYQIGGPAEIFIDAPDEKDVLETVKLCNRAGIKITVLGGGSNVLIADEGIEGVVLRLYSKLLPPRIENGIIQVNASTPNEDFCIFVAQNGVGGFEFLFDIPGTIGGGVVQNAGMNDEEIKNHLISVQFIDSTGKIISAPVSELNLNYRTSRFKEEFGIVVSALFKIPYKESPDTIKKKMEDIRFLRRSKFPEEHRNCGSVFKRPSGDYAGRLIEAAGLGGTRIGDAMISNKHKNFIVNIGNASEKDVKELVTFIQKKVKERSGILLEPEVVFLPK